MRNARAEAGFTQAELATKSTISVPAIARYESGKRAPHLAEALLLAQLEWARAALGTDRVWLHVTEGNDRARRLYERVGFRATGVVDRFEGYDGDSNEMVILLAR